MKDNVVLLIDGNRGIYTYQEFAKHFNPENSYWVYNLDDAQVLRDGPDNDEWYGEAWMNVLDDAYYLDPEGNNYHLYEYEGNIFAVKDGHKFAEDLD